MMKPHKTKDQQANSPLIEIIRDAIQRYQLIPPGTKVVVGVSGGADSVALVHALHQLEIPLTVAHINHQLRGEASDADEQFVRELAEKLQLPFVHKSINVAQLSDESGESIEMAARKARHSFFAQLSPSVIALAHHADDQVETFFLKLARGAGTDGLSGMDFRQSMESFQIIRPMLEIPRDQIIKWLAARQIKWREDQTNTDLQFLRNRVRHSLLPLLEKELNPMLRKAVLRSMNILREENRWMNSLLDGLTLSDDLPIAMQRRLLRKWLFDHHAEDIGLESIDALLALKKAAKGSVQFTLNSHQRVVIEYGKLRFETNGLPLRQPLWEISQKKGVGWKKEDTKTIGQLPAEASFCAAMVGDSPVMVRSVEPGDCFEPLGVSGHRKLQDIFTDCKVPRAQRALIPVVICRDEIIWIPGYRIAKKWRVRGDKEASIYVSIEQRVTELN